MLVHPVRDDYWLFKQCWLLGDSYSATEPSAIVSPRTLENCPCICPRAFWQHPSVLSAESQLIMKLVNLGLSTTCLPHTFTAHAQTWMAQCGLPAASLHLIHFPEVPHLHLRQHEGKRNGTCSQVRGLLELVGNLLKVFAKMQGPPS